MPFCVSDSALRPTIGANDSGSGLEISAKVTSISFRLDRKRSIFIVNLFNASMKKWEGG